MPDVNRIGSNLPNLETNSSGAEQLMDLLRDSQIKPDDLSEKIKDLFSNLPKSEADTLLERIKNNDSNDPLGQSLNERMNKADTRDLIKTLDSKIPSVPLGGGKLPTKEPDIKSVPLGGSNRNRISEPPIKTDPPSVPLGGGDKIGKDPEIPSVRLGGGKVHGKEPDIQPVPLGGQRKAEMDMQSTKREQDLRNMLTNKISNNDKE